MKYSKIGSLLPVIGIAITALVVLTGCSPSTKNTLLTPEFEEPEAPPMEVTIDQLYAEFIADRDAAMAKYEGQKLSFIGVVAEDVSNNFYIERADDFYIVSGNVRFKARYVNDIEAIRRGWVLDIVGQVRDLFGFESHYLLVDNCWINIVEGDPNAYYGEPEY